MDHFIINIAKKHKKIDEDGHYSSSLSSDIDMEAYMKDFLG